MKSFAVVLGLVLAISVTSWGLPSLDPSWDHSTKVSITPQSPSPSDEISVTVSRWVEAGYQVDSSTLRVQGNVIHLDLHLVRKGVSMDVYPPMYCRKEHTESIDKWSPGRYGLIVSNDGKDSAFANFTVAGKTAGSAPGGGSLIERLLGALSSFNSDGQSAIDRLRDLLSGSHAQ
jgi:hypothetical protein